MSDQNDHDAYWDERLQDAVDGDLDPMEQTAFDLHLEHCNLCRSRLHALQRLDGLLTEMPIPRLDPLFESRVLAGIDAAFHSERAVALQRARRDREIQLAALSDRWHTIWRRVFLDGIAGTALVVTLAMAFGLSVSVTSAVDHSVRALGQAADRFSRALNAS